MKKVFRIPLHIAVVFGIFSILIVIPFLIEKIVLNDSYFLFNSKIILSRESWFGFISSYIGAIGTVGLGIIALWQNKRYKELSDISSKEVKEIQIELKELSEKMVNAVKTLERIELAIYTPVIEKIPYNFYGLSKEDLDGKFKNEDIVYQYNLLNVKKEECALALDKLMDKYKTFGFTIRNIGEKAIRNFTCTEVKIEGERVGFQLGFKRDITSSGCANILFVNLPLNRECTKLDLKFEFNNLLMEQYCFDVEIIITYKDEYFDASCMEFELPYKC